MKLFNCYMFVSSMIVCQHSYATLIESAEISNAYIPFAISHDQWLGIRFDASQDTTISKIGASLSHSRGSGFTGFLGIFKLQADAFPTLPVNLCAPYAVCYNVHNHPDLIYSEIVDIPYPNLSDVILETNINIVAGSYALIVGGTYYYEDTILLGIGESAFINANNPSYFFLDTDEVWGEYNRGFIYGTAARFILEGDNISVATAAEPTTLALFGLGLVGLGFSRRKKI